METTERFCPICQAHTERTDEGRCVDCEKAETQAYLTALTADEQEYLSKRSNGQN